MPEYPPTLGFYYMETVEIAKAFVAATTDILSTMAFITPTVGKVFVKTDKTALGDFSAVVGVTGKHQGSICVTFSRAGAISITKSMLGDDLENLEQDVADTVGEIANMVSGRARAAIAEKGVTLQGSTPTVVVGANHRITHLSKAPVMCIPFTIPEGTFTVEFCLE
jgi:chemotaxis protein CheX